MIFNNAQKFERKFGGFNIEKFLTLNGDGKSCRFLPKPIAKFVPICYAIPSAFSPRNREKKQENTADSVAVSYVLVFLKNKQEIRRLNRALSL